MTRKNTVDTATAERWKKGNDFERSVLLERIGARNHDRGSAIAELSRTEQYIALTAIAQDQYNKALGHLGAAAGAWAYLLQRFSEGDDVDRRLLDQAGNGFILAAASGDEATIDRMIRAYGTAVPDGSEMRSPDIILGKTLRALSLRDVESASQLLVTVAGDSSRPETVAMLESIVDHDDERFRSAIASSADQWRKTIRAERLQKFPDAVCDHWAIGNIRLAERVWGRRPEVDLSAANIPPAFFDAVAEPVEGTL